jgi:hypothetical protein
MDYLYFPGCTLNTKAKNFDQTARSCSLLLGFELKELENWTCCGATFPLATDNIMALLPPSRILATAREEGTALTTLCAVCFNVIKRTNRLIQGDGEKRDKINNFIEKNYQGDLQVLHYLEILKQGIGFPQLKEKVKKPLAGLKAAASGPLRRWNSMTRRSPLFLRIFLKPWEQKRLNFPTRSSAADPSNRWVHPMWRQNVPIRFSAQLSKTGRRRWFPHVRCAPSTLTTNNLISNRNTQISNPSPYFILLNCLGWPWDSIIKLLDLSRMQWTLCLS